MKNSKGISKRLTGTSRKCPTLRRMGYYNGQGPPSVLGPDGKVTPAYAAWAKANSPQMDVKKRIACAQCGMRRMIPVDRGICDECLELNRMVSRNPITRPATTAIRYVAIGAQVFECRLLYAQGGYAYVDIPTLPTADNKARCFSPRAVHVSREAAMFDCWAPEKS